MSIYNDIDKNGTINDNDRIAVGYSLAQYYL